MQCNTNHNTSNSVLELNYKSSMKTTDKCDPKAGRFLKRLKVNAYFMEISLSFVCCFRHKTLVEYVKLGKKLGHLSPHLSLHDQFCEFD